MTDIPDELCGTWKLKNAGLIASNMVKVLDLATGAEVLKKQGMTQAQWNAFKQEVIDHFKPETVTITKDGYTINGVEPPWDSSDPKPSWWTWELGKKMPAQYDVKGSFDITVTDTSGPQQVTVEPKKTHITPWHAIAMANAVKALLANFKAADPKDQPEVTAIINAMTEPANLMYVKGSGMGTMETMLVVVLGLAVVWMLMNYKK